MAKAMKSNDPQRAKAYFEDKINFTTGPVEVDYLAKQDEEFVLIDVRAEEDFEEEHARGAINLPEDKWNSFEGLTKDKANILYCYSQTCHLAARAALSFAEAGFPVVEMEGGFEAWKDNELETESGKTKAETTAA